MLDEIAALIRNNKKLRDSIDDITADNMSQSNSINTSRKNSPNTETALVQCVQ